MGLFKKSCYSSPYAIVNSNPNPIEFEIRKEDYVNGFLILLVHYPGCTNYEGNKLLVYRGFKTSKALINYNLGKLDPHFSTGRGSPIARFKPDSKSLKLIEKMIS